MKIDAHQHLWRYSTQEYGWIGPEKAILKKDHLPGNLRLQLSSVGLDGSVAVRARQALEETRWLFELAQQHLFIPGVVGWVDLCSLELPAQLEESSVYSTTPTSLACATWSRMRQRIMFGSDWPVCTLAGAYSQVVEIVADYVDHLSEDEQAAVWGATAGGFYNLP